MLQDWQLAEDAVQEAFLAAYQNIGQLRDPDAFPGWFRRIVYNQCHRIIRRRHRRTEYLYADPESCAEVDDNPHLQQEFAQSLDRLPRHQYAVVRLFYWEGYSYAEIARRLGVPVSTVKKRLYDARQRLKKWCAEGAEEEDHAADQE